MAGDVDDVPALGVFKDITEPVPGHAVLKDAHVGRFPGGGDAVNEPDKLMAFPPQVERLAALRETEQAEHPQPGPAEAGPSALPVCMTRVMSCPARGLP